MGTEKIDVIKGMHLGSWVLLSYLESLLNAACGSVDRAEWIFWEAPSTRVPVPKGHTVCELERCLQTSWVPWDLKVPSQASPIQSLPKGWSHIGPGVHTLISWSLFANLYQQPSTSCMCMCCRKLDTSSLTFLRLLCTLYMSLWVGTDNRL